MIRLRRGTVVQIVEERAGLVEMSVEVEGSLARAVAYPGLTGPVTPGDHVLLNTTAVALGLGTGGTHFVVAVEGRHTADPEPGGHVMKLRYTPLQAKVRAIEEPGEPGHERLAGPADLAGLPVVWVPLHSMVGPAAAGARAAGARRVVYVMTDGAALPAPLSRVAAALRTTGILDAVVTAGQAFGGDAEAVTVFSALLASKHVLRADTVIVGDGPGNTGTATAWGATDVASASSLNAAGILGGRPIAALRISFSDPRARHRGVSHHSLTALGNVALVPVNVAVPAIEDDRRRNVVWQALREAKLQERHQLVEATGQPAMDLLSERGVEAESMGRMARDDPEFFLAAGAAGVLAGRMAAKDRREWEEGRPRGPALPTDDEPG
jgi:hypothetical protein